MCRHRRCILINEYDKIISLSDSEQVQLGASFKELLNTWLHLGMSRYVCRNGTLSEGHEKLTDAQIYAQSIREMYSLSTSIKQQRCQAMEAKADLMDYEEELAAATKPSAKLRLEAKVLSSQQRLVGALVMIEDQLRQMDEFNKVRQELEQAVTSKYNSIEDAEPSNWEAVLKYRVVKNRMNDKSAVCHVPIPMEQKAALAIKFDAPEAAIWLSSVKDEEINKKFGGDIRKYLQAQESNVFSLEEKKWQKPTGQPSGPTLA